MIRSEPTPRAGPSLAFMLEERRRLRRHQLMLEGLLKDLREDLDRSQREKRRQEAYSGWCDPDLAHRVELLHSDLTRVSGVLHQVRRAIQVASGEIERLLRCRKQPGIVAMSRREAC